MFVGTVAFRVSLYRMYVPTEPRRSPRLSPSLTNAQDLMCEYVRLVKIVAATEAALRDKTGEEMMVISTHLGQDNV